MKAQWKVRGHEDVTVPAGTFETLACGVHRQLRIRADDLVDARDGGRLRPARQRTPGKPPARRRHPGDRVGHFAGGGSSVENRARALGAPCVVAYAPGGPSPGRPPRPIPRLERPAWRRQQRRDGNPSAAGRRSSVLVGGDHGQGLGSAAGSPAAAGPGSGRPARLLGGLELALGVDDLARRSRSASAAWRRSRGSFRSGRRAIGRRWWWLMPQASVWLSRTAGQVEPLALGQHLVERVLAEHGAQRGLSWLVAAR